MAEEGEQAKPLGPASRHINIYDEKALPAVLKHHRHRRLIKCCGCLSAAILILSVIALALAFTVLHVQGPVMRLNSVKIEGWSNFTWTNLRPGLELKVRADVSVKNPNAASFKYDNATSSLYYDGRIIGKARTPPGSAGARRTVRLNVTFDAKLDKILSAPRLRNDLVYGTLPLRSYTRIGGRVSYFKGIRKGVVVEMNCTMKITIASQQIKDQDCNQRVSLR